MLPAALIVLSFACVQADDAARIDALIRALDAEELDAREQAGRDLLKIGEPAIPALERTIKEPPNEEIKGRAAGILASIRRDARRRTFPGGKVIGGFSACTTVEQREGGAVVVTVEIMNVGTTPATYVPIQIAGFVTPGESWEHASDQGCFRVRQVSGERPETSTSFSACGPGPDKTPATLAPGHSQTHSVTLQIRDDKHPDGLAPGDYEADFSYFAKKEELLKGAPEDLVSNTVKFTIKE